MELPVCLFNFQDGGRRGPGSYDFVKFLRAFADVPKPPAIIVVNESKEWGLWGSTALHRAGLTLSQRFDDTPYVGLLGWCDRGDFGPTIFYDASRIAVTRWDDGRHGMSSDTWLNVARFVTRREQIPFGVIAQHWSSLAGAERLPEARRIDRFGEAEMPFFVAGDLNGTASGPHLPKRNWGEAGVKGCAHKGKRLPDGTWTADTDAVDYLIGEWCEETGCRINGLGFTAVAELAYFRGNNQAMTPTVNDGVDPGGGLLIDWVLLNDAWMRRGGVNADSYKVHIPRGDRRIWPSDHRLLYMELFLN